jgi:excisionase family DNA binding protein
MSSKIEIDKTCDYCGKLFTARTLYTRYCSHTCNKRGYKAIKRQERIDNHMQVAATKKVAVSVANASTIKEIQAKEYLSVTETCVLVGVSRNTLFRWINGRILPTYRQGTKHLIRREDINKIFSNGKKEN